MAFPTGKTIFHFPEKKFAPQRFLANNMEQRKILKSLRNYTSTWTISERFNFDDREDCNSFPKARLSFGIHFRGVLRARL